MREHDNELKRICIPSTIPFLKFHPVSVRFQNNPISFHKAHQGFIFFKNIKNALRRKQWTIHGFTADSELDTRTGGQVI